MELVLIHRGLFLQRELGGTIKMLSDLV